MKMRSGFVSNSSSSCFVIALEKVPATEKELQKLLFGEKNAYSDPYEEDKTYTAEEVTSVVWNDIKEPLTPDGVREAIPSGYIDGHQQADEFIASHKDCIFLEFEYGDDTPLGCAMEHGDLFNRIPCFRTSHH